MSAKDNKPVNTRFGHVYFFRQVNSIPLFHRYSYKNSTLHPEVNLRARGSKPCDTVDVIRSVPFRKLPPLPRQPVGAAAGRLVPAVNQLDVACLRQRREPT